MGNLVKYYRKSFDMSQRELAQIAGVSHVQISNIEKDIHDPGIRTAQKIATALKTTTDILWPPEEGENQ